MNYKDFQDRVERYDRENRRYYYFMILRVDEVNCKILLNLFKLYENCSFFYYFYVFFFYYLDGEVNDFVNQF